MKKLKLLVSIFVLFGLFMSCNDDDSGPSTSKLTLSLSGLQDLGDDYVYEGWLIVDGSPISTGIFSVAQGGALSETSFDVSKSSIENATKFVLTIEPTGETGDAAAKPSDVKILGGDFSGSSANVSIMDPAAFGTGFTGVKGSYILATPTSIDDSDELQGVWFLDNSSGSPVAGLTSLPDLSGFPGWVYEGWAVVNGNQAYSTGTFNTASGADDNASSSLTKGADSNGPGFPGEDFIMNLPDDFPDDLSSATFVISIEPVPDNSPDPFTLKVLLGDVPATATSNTVYTLGNIAASTYPSGVVTR